PGGKARDGDDLGTLRLPREHEAGAHERPVEVDRARPALALLAGVLGSRQTHPLAQHVEQALALPDAVDLVALAVDGALEPHRRPPSARAQPSVRWASTPSAWTRYAAVLRTSSIGRADAATSSPKRSSAESGSGPPSHASASP